LGAEYRDRTPAGEKAYILQRQSAAWELRTKGWSVMRIADKLAVSTATISNDLQVKLSEFAESESRNADQWRNEELAKLDRVIETQMAKSESESVRSADHASAVIRAIELKAKMRGLFMPVDINVTGTLTFADLLRVRKDRLRQQNTIDGVIVAEEVTGASESIAGLLATVNNGADTTPATVNNAPIDTLASVDNGAKITHENNTSHE
jgi:predicted transcriptional regulator